MKSSAVNTNILKIKPLLPEHWPQVAQIYLDGITTQLATFETQVPNWESWNLSHLKDPRLVALEDQMVLGWAALSPVSSRCVYGGVAEVSVYVSQSHRGKNIGYQLMKSLIRQSEACGFWSLQSGIFTDNIASIKLHEKVGFRTIGIREKIGKLNHQWKDNLLMERRSKIIGID